MTNKLSFEIYVILFKWLNATYRQIYIHKNKPSDKLGFRKDLTPKVFVERAPTPQTKLQITLY